jgi:[ribosomal protein S5]-alanine N-acetyltransferase
MLITTPSAILRSWTLSDLESLSKNADNPRIAANMRDAFASPYTSEDAYQFISMATSRNGNLFLTIDLHNEAIGGIGIHPLDDVKRRTAEIGYWLSESYWGMGIVTDAVRSLVPVAFGMFDIVRLQAGVYSSNPASMRVLEKCGFVYEAIHKDAIYKNGVLLDEIIYVKFRESRSDHPGISG